MNFAMKSNCFNFNFAKRTCSTCSACTCFPNTPKGVRNLNPSVPLYHAVWLEYFYLVERQVSKFVTIQCRKLVHLKIRENRIRCNIFQNVTICFL